jgi:hypothetical protein
MSITAEPGVRLGDHVVLTVTLPVHYVVLEHHGKDVKICVDLLRQFAKRWGNDAMEYRYDAVHLTWQEEVTLREAGWMVLLSNGMMWPTATLVSALAAWEKQVGIA